MAFRPLPIGVDNFEKVIQGGFYYVDKTLFIKELLDMRAEVNLFTRPRRWGKTLNVSMLQYFFEDTGDKTKNEKRGALFNGLNIMNAGEPYLRHMNAYPVISISLKSAKRSSYSSSYYKLCEELRSEYDRHRGILEKLPEEKQRRYLSILNNTASPDEYSSGLKFLSEVLQEAYHKKVIILIDEYDVPLENSYFEGFYEEMMDFIRSMFESALKTNPCLEFAVMTGCLRISKESIFTGLNNLKIISILSEAYGENFGFLQREVDDMLDFYHLRDVRALIREWYDGYQFGNAEVYNPWSVINYVDACITNKEAFPAPYWNNTSSNAIVRDLVDRAEPKTKLEIEQLVSGKTIGKPVHEDITYADIYSSEDNLWNFLFFTGYLKKVSMSLRGDSRYVELAIPNREVRYIYNNTIINWFQSKIKEKDLSELYQGLLSGDAKRFQKELSALLMESISYMDGGEAFYHGFLLGILENMKEYIVTSNREGGLGRYDIAVRHLDVSKTPVILELKVSDTFKGLEASCDEALNQISEKHYDDWLPDEGYSEVINYGVAFFKKQCKIKAQRREF